MNHFLVQIYVWLQNEPLFSSNIYLATKWTTFRFKYISEYIMNHFFTIWRPHLRSPTYCASLCRLGTEWTIVQIDFSQNCYWYIFLFCPLISELRRKVLSWENKAPKITTNRFEIIWISTVAYKNNFVASLKMIQNGRQKCWRVPP